MATFPDSMMLRLRDPDTLQALLTPPVDPDHARLRTALSATYDLPFASIHALKDVKVVRTQSQLPLFRLRRTFGTELQTIPSHERTEVQYETADRATPAWIDILADLTLTLVLDMDPAEVASIELDALGPFATVDEFRAKFAFLDVDAFMARQGITTVEELREAFHYLRGEVTLVPRPTFDPNEPANEHHFELHLAILLRDAIDLVASLREAKQVRSTAEHSVSFRPGVDAAEVRTPYAPVLVFPEDALSGTTATETELTKFFATERVLALFITS